MGKRKTAPTIGAHKVRSALGITPNLPRLAIARAEERTDDPVGIDSEHCPPKMAQPKSPTTNGDDPAWKRLGMYTVLGEIAEGTFGTVKREFESFAKRDDWLIREISCKTHYYRTPSGDEVSRQSADPSEQHQESRPQRGRIYAPPSPPSYRPIVCRVSRSIPHN